MSGSTDPWGEAALITLALLALPYYAARYPLRTYRLLVHRIGWYS